HAVQRALALGIAREHALKDGPRLLILRLIDQVVALVEQPFFRRKGRGLLLGRGGGGGEFDRRQPLGFFLGVNAQNHLFIKQVHRSILPLVIAQGLVKIGRQDQPRGRQLLDPPFGFGLRVFVHAQLDGANQALGNQQGKVFLEIARQRGRVAREREQALFLVDLDRILQRQTIQKEVKVLMPNLGELEVLRGRYHQVVILAVDSRLHLVRRR